MELMSVRRGVLKVEAGSEAAAVRAGATLRFAVEGAHRYVNPGKIACEFHMVVLEPVG